MNEAILHTTGLSKQYGKTKAVKDANFVLKKGEVHAIIGENGAGKSTFVKMLYGETIPSGGSLYISGLEKRFSGPSDAIANGIAMVSQDLALVDQLSIAENIALTGSVKKHSLRYDEAQNNSYAESALLNIGFNIDVKRKVETLTIYEKQLVAIAKGLSLQAEIIIFDEPTSILGEHAIAQVQNLINVLKKLGKSIIYITHKLPEVFAFADTVSFFKQGTIQLTTPVGQTTPEFLLEQFSAKPAHDSIPTSTIKREDPLLQINSLVYDNLDPLTMAVYAGETVGIYAENMQVAKELIAILLGEHRQYTGTIEFKKETLTGSISGRIKKELDSSQIEG